MAPRAPTVEWSQDRPVEQQILREYGVGIDCHSRFLQVCVLVNQGGSVTRVEREFSTDWGEICNAKAWALDHLQVLPKPPRLSDLCYTLVGQRHFASSTGTIQARRASEWIAVSHSLACASCLYRGTKWRCPTRVDWHVPSGSHDCIRRPSVCGKSTPGKPLAAENGRP